MSRQGTAQSRTRANIRAFWESEAAECGDSPQVTIRDHCFRLHELHTLLSLIPRSRRLLDVGCGTGFGTLCLSRRAASSVGVDLSAGMIQWAERLRDDPAYRAKVFGSLSPLWTISDVIGDVQFRVGDVLALELGSADFDVVTGQRILINLPTHDDQMRALARFRAHVQPGALLLSVEATHQGHQRTDEYRQRFGLPTLEKYWHNNYVDETRRPDWERAGWRVEDVLGFETYMLLSKVVYPAACGPDRCAFLSGANFAAMEVANLFRTRAAAQEIGIARMLLVYLERVRLYDPEEAQAIEGWLQRSGKDMPDWSGLGHQQLVIARAC